MSSSVPHALDPSSSLGFPAPSQSPGGGGGNGGGGGGGGGMTLANSASLYLYTFLATLVLLLSVSGAIVVRSYILRRRHRRMVEEAMRNGTWIPPMPAARPPRVDLSKKPELWEAYLGGGGWQVGGLGNGSGKEGTNWKFDYSKDWESIKPICADYATSQSPPSSGSTHNLTTLSPPVPNPNPAPITLLTHRGDEENQQTAQISTTPSLLARARQFINPPLPTFPLPLASTAADNGTNNAHSTNISVTELSSNSPTTVRVAVLIAMPSLSSHGSSTPPSTSYSSSPSSKPQLTTSDPLQSSCSPRPNATNDEQPLPLLEMGVAEVVICPSEDSPTWDNGHRREEKVTYSRGSSYAE